MTFNYQPDCTLISIYKSIECCNPKHAAYIAFFNDIIYVGEFNNQESSIKHNVTQHALGFRSPSARKFGRIIFLMLGHPCKMNGIQVAATHVFHIKLSQTREMKPDVLKLGTALHVQGVFVSLYQHTSKVTTLKEDRNINFRHLRFDIALCLTPKLMGCVFLPAIFQERAVWWESKPRSQLPIRKESTLYLAPGMLGKWR